MAAKKKARKKPKKKLPPKKRPKKGGKGGRGRKKPTYVLHIGKDGKISAADRNPHPRSHKSDGGRPDTVAWHNDSDRGYTILFNINGWPFVEPPVSIEVIAGRDSATFTVYSGAVVTEPDGTRKQYKYTEEPYPPGGPGDPVVIPED